MEMIPMIAGVVADGAGEPLMTAVYAARRAGRCG
jgi:hypothetical protein